MSTISTIDLSSLPAPGVIEELDFEVILRAMRDDLVARFPPIAPVIDLQSEPARKLLEVCAYRELLLRQRVNDAARANLLAFAGTTDLDHLGSFYGVTRLTDETDIALRLRVQQRIQGWSNAGGAAHYRYWALTADERVSDAAVSSPSAGIVRIAVLSAEGDGASSEDLLTAVRAIVLRDDVRVLTDTVEVVSASIVPVDVAATVFLYPDTPAQVIEQLRIDFPARFAAARGLGWDLTRSWINAQLHPSGVQRVHLTAPATDTDGQTRLSFGRVFPATVPAPEVRTHAGIFVDHVGRAFLPGRFVLSDSVLDDDRATPNPFIYHAHLFTLANADGVPDEPADFEPMRKFQRAQMVLSEGMRLGDINSRTPPVDWVFYEGRRRLSEEAAVSGTPAEVRRIRRTEMFERRSAGSALAPAPMVAARWSHVLRTHAFGGRSQVYRLSETARQLPPVWYAQPARALAAETYEVAVRVRDAVRADARVADAERFIPSQVLRADARSVGDALRLIPTNPALALLPELYDPAASPIRFSEVTGDTTYAGQFWLPLYHMDQPWSEVQVLVGAMHKTENT